MGHDVSIGIAAGLGQFELNVYKPLIALASGEVGGAHFDAWVQAAATVRHGPG